MNEFTLFLTSESLAWKTPFLITTFLEAFFIFLVKNFSTF